ncbi:hypothetical protein BDF20DRAFT_521103 [Mycotypha africana]|uniref:uncharacterized protein n=1 Tax=Mycotypha africana TaxID=64632 RepID=UPI00230088F3|nr:uncharacterized protein BDF20DRAFT_521103 [Mycotypha africana]KAI8979612.1 hypothetical protein BDF20DRAFT_521103 [Mycotypha africana]
MTMKDDNNNMILMNHKDETPSMAVVEEGEVSVHRCGSDKMSNISHENEMQASVDDNPVLPVDETNERNDKEDEESINISKVEDNTDERDSIPVTVVATMDSMYDRDISKTEEQSSNGDIDKNNTSVHDGGDDDDDDDDERNDTVVKDTKRHSSHNQPLTAELLAEQNELFSKKSHLLEPKPNSIRAWAADLPNVPDTVQPILTSTLIFEMDSLTLEEEQEEAENGTQLGDGLEADAAKEQHPIQETKDIFSDTQKIAYVGLCYLTSLEVVYDFEGKDFTYARMSAGNWQRKLMRMLYMHMDISEDEINMIESLSKHAILPTDLVHQFTSQGETTEVELNHFNTKKQQQQQQQQQQHSLEQEQPPTLGNDNTKDPASIRDNKIIVDLRWTVMCDLFLLCLSTENYDARSRVFIARVASHLSLDWFQVIGFEKRIAEQLLEDAANSSSGWETESITTVATNMTSMTTNTMTMTDIAPSATGTAAAAVRNDVEKKGRNKQRKKKRVVMIGLATIGGGLILGLSAGLMAPVIAGGIGAILTTIGVTGSSAFLGSTTGIALITGGATLAGGRMGAKGMSKRTKQIQTFEFVPVQVDENVNCIISITGWLPNQEKDESSLPFSTLDPLMGDHYHLYWEPEMLEALGGAFKIFATEAVTFSIQQALAHTIMGTLLAGLAWPLALTKLGYMVDNPWANALDRSRQAGLILADTLMNRNLGARPVTLVGYSLGARVIFFCLLELARMKAYGLVENVALFGTPVSASKAQWKECTTIVSGRFINGYATNDWLLGFLFRTSTAGLGNIAGLRPLLHIEGDRVQNLDCTDLVNGHLTYRAAMPKLLKRAGFVVTSEELPIIEKEKSKSEDSSIKNKNQMSTTASLNKSDSMNSLSSANINNFDETMPVRTASSSTTGAPITPGNEPHSPTHTSLSLPSAQNNNNTTTNTIDTTINNTTAMSEYDIIADILANATAAASSKAGTYSSLSSGKASIATTPSNSTEQHSQQQSMTRSSSSISIAAKKSFFGLRFNKLDPTLDNIATTTKTSTSILYNDNNNDMETISSTTNTNVQPTSTASRFFTGAASIFNIRKKQETEEEKELREAGVQVKEIKGTLGTLVVPKEIANPMPQVRLEAPQFARLNK